MGRRRQKRLPAIVPVRIWGTDREGTAFSEYVCTVDISGRGARVGGVRAALCIGDTVSLQCHHRQAQFRITWIEQQGAPAGPQVGLHCLEPDKELWPTTLPGDEADDFVVPEARSRKYDSREQGRRNNTRYAVSGKAYVSGAGGGNGEWAKLEDISLSGCYLGTAHPFGVGHKLTVLLQVANAEIKAKGVVRVCYPRGGIGIEFVHLADPDLRRLRDLVAYLEEIDNALSLLNPHPSQPQSCSSAGD